MTNYGHEYPIYLGGKRFYTYRLGYRKENNVLEIEENNIESDLVNNGDIPLIDIEMVREIVEQTIETYESTVTSSEDVSADVINRLDTLTNIQLVSMVGIGIFIGVCCSQIFSRYFSA